jgi:hypothetical protein
MPTFMCICNIMYICEHITIFLYVCIFLHITMHIWKRERECVYMCVCLHKRICSHLHRLHTYLHRHIYVCVCVYVASVFIYNMRVRSLVYCMSRNSVHTTIFRADWLLHIHSVFLFHTSLNSQKSRNLSILFSLFSDWF